MKRREGIGDKKGGKTGTETKGGFKSSVVGLEEHTFEYGSPKHVAKFVKTQKQIANYIQKKYDKGGAEIASAVRTLTMPNIRLPTEPDPATATLIEMEIWKNQYRRADEKRATLEDNVKRAYALVYDQCSPALQTKLKGQDDYNNVEANQDVVGLMELIRGICCKYDASSEPVMSLVQAKRRVYTCYQGQKQTNDEYAEELEAYADVVEAYGGQFGNEPGYLDAVLVNSVRARDPRNPTAQELDNARAILRDNMMAAMLISGADNTRFRSLKMELRNQYSQGQDNYPRTMAKALDILNGYQNPNNRYVGRAANAGGVAFTQVNQGGANRRGNCYACGEPGHFARECPKQPDNNEDSEEQIHINIDDEVDEPTGVGFVQDAFVQRYGYRLDPTHLYLDTCSTFSQVVRREFLKDVHRVDKGLTAYCNAGKTYTDVKGKLGSMDVWLNTLAIANIISFTELEKKYRISYDTTDTGGEFVVHTPKGEVRFKRNNIGLPYINLRDNKAAICLINTIRGNAEGYTKRQIKKAQEARRAMSMVGGPTEREFTQMVRRNQLPNCNITPNDIKHANDIFGPDLAGIRGKTTRRKPERVEGGVVGIPARIVEANKFVWLAGDVMFVDGIAFVVTVSRGLKFITTHYLPTRTADDLAQSLKETIKIYERGGFRVQTLLMDGEFEKIKQKLPEVIVNTTAAGEHVGEVERHIRTIKERGRGVMCTLPYKRMPARMVVELVYFCAMWLNALPNRNGVSEDYSPRELVVRQRMDYKKHCQVPFGAYCEVFEDRDRTNTMASRTRGAICLGPTGNMQGTYKFLCLDSGKVINRRQFKELPMPASVIRKVEDMGKRGTAGNLVFSDRNGVPFPWNDDPGEAETDRAPPEQDGTIAEFPGVPIEMDCEVENTEEGDVDGEQEQAALAAANANLDVEQPQLTFGRRHITANEEAIIRDILEGETQAEEDGYMEGDADTDEDEDRNETGGEQDGGDATEPEHAVDNAPDITQTEQAGPDLRRSGRRNKGKRETHTFAEEFQGDGEMQLLAIGEEDQEIAPLAEHEVEEHIVGVVMTQYMIGQGLKLFQRRGEEAITSELGKLHNMQTFVPVHRSELTDEEHKRAVGSLMFLKEKRDQSIRGRMVADGRKQRETARKGDAASPTVCVESIFITAAIEAFERRDVATVDLPSAYLHAENDETVHMKLHGRLAELMGRVEPSLYRKYITTDSRGKPVLYVRLHKAIYGLLKSALLFYRKLRGQLEGRGFVINPYDPCVANKWTRGGQLTVTWHVDDLKISHKNPSCVTETIQWLESLYGNLREQRGKVHDYLGITLDYNTPGVVRVSMVEYIKGLIRDFPEEINGEVTSPAPNHLFLVRDEAEATKLPEEQAMCFHHTVAQLLFLSTRARKDIQVAVAFLTTRVKSPDEDDWGKLKRVLKYLNGTTEMRLNLSIENLSVTKWYVDAAHAVHEDCKSHSGAALTLGKGMVTSMSRKQKLNGKSSTESELIAVDDAMAQILWTRYFIQAQGYKMGPSIIYQDNKSAILLEVNGKGSTSKRTKHIKVRYFFVKDKINSGEMVVEYCPKDRMWADVLTKPLQGTEYKVFRSKLMNVPVDFSNKDPYRTDTTNEDRKVSFAKGTKPPTGERQIVDKPIYKRDRLQECVGGQRNETRPKKQRTVEIRRKPYVRVFSNRKGDNSDPLKQ